jgi:hypothetical protein
MSLNDLLKPYIKKEIIFEEYMYCSHCCYYNDCLYFVNCIFINN